MFGEVPQFAVFRRLRPQNNFHIRKSARKLCNNNNCLGNMPQQIAASLQPREPQPYPAEPRE